jgi:2,5-furandicarboxylate decarboxylase 1
VVDTDGGLDVTSQDLRHFLDEYQREHPDDVLNVAQPLDPDQDLTAIVWELASRGHHELLRVAPAGSEGHEVVTNMFASRTRIERMLGAAPDELHERYEQLAAAPSPLQEVDGGPVTEHIVTGADVDLGTLPLITHFATDLGPYITSGIIVAEDPDTGCGNLSYHRAVVSDTQALATSLHSRGDLWRLLQDAERRGEPLPVAMVIGAHPLFMLAASARVPLDVDEREVAGGLFGAPLEVIRTPLHGLRVPASAEYVLEGVIDPTNTVAEGPFGEFSGYSSDRSTHNRFDVQAILHRSDPIWVDVVGGNSNEHLNLARVPRESEMSTKLKDRFPSVESVHYPNSGTHFHCYVAVDQRRPGEARQIMLALLGWDPYLKTVIAVDTDVDVTNDSDVLWALATHFQPAQDLFVVDGLPGSPLDPSSSPDGSTSRLGLDATRGPDFDGTRIVISDEVRTRATDVVAQLIARGDQPDV